MKFRMSSDNYESIPHRLDKPSLPFWKWYALASVASFVVLHFGSLVLQGSEIGASFVGWVAGITDMPLESAQSTACPERAELILALSVFMWPVVLLSHVLLNTRTSLRVTLPPALLVTVLLAGTVVTLFILYGGPIADPHSVRPGQRSIGEVMTSSPAGLSAALSALGCLFVMSWAVLLICVRHYSKFHQFRFKLSHGDES